MTNKTNVNVTVISIWSKRSADASPFSYSVEVNASSAKHALDLAFTATNMDDRPFGKQVPSTSVGDILVIDGQHYLVDPDGFSELTLEQSQFIQKRLTSRDTGFGFDAIFVDMLNQ